MVLHLKKDILSNTLISKKKINKNAFKPFIFLKKKILQQYECFVYALIYGFKVDTTIKNRKESINEQKKIYPLLFIEYLSIFKSILCQSFILKICQICHDQLQKHSKSKKGKKKIAQKNEPERFLKSLNNSQNLNVSTFFYKN